MDKRFPIDLTDPKWWSKETRARRNKRKASPDDVMLNAIEPSHEAIQTVLNWCSDFIEPDLRFMYEALFSKKSRYFPSDFSPDPISAAPEVLDLSQAISMLAVGGGVPVFELEGAVLECLFGEFNNSPLEPGDNCVAASWLAYVRHKNVWSFENKNGVDALGCAEELFLQKLRTGAFIAYGIPSGTSGKYQEIPIEALMYPLHIKYLRNSLSIAPVDNSYEEKYTFCRCNEDLDEILSAAAAAGTLVKEWREIRVYKRDIEKYCPKLATKRGGLKKGEEPASRKPAYRQNQIIPYLRKLDSLPTSITKEFLQKIRKDLNLSSLDKNTLRRAVLRCRLMPKRRK